MRCSCKHRSGACYRIIECDVPLAPGDSGVPLFNGDANLLGLQGVVRGRSLRLGRKLKAVSNRASAVAPDW
ncbi:MAG: hypothetical protein KDN22_14845 [Verrucomicrobiae bacterium]|nr:hypothetical protein [Verrucomicrobiae bacterium]